jgi:hypothetical protein
MCEVWQCRLSGCVQRAHRLRIARNVRRLLGSLFAAAVIVLAAASVANAGFSSQLTPITGLLPVGNSVLNDSAVSPSGDVMLVWSEGATSVVVKARRLHPDGTLGPELTMSDGTERAGGARVGFAPDGSAVVAWSERPNIGNASVRARWINPDDTLGPEYTLRSASSSSDSAEVGLTVTTTGAALVAWHNFTSTPDPFRTIEARHVTPNGPDGTLITAFSGAGSTGTEVVPDTSGGALLSWREAGIKARAIAANNNLGTSRTPAAASSAGPVLATDGANHFRVIYRQGTSPNFSLDYQNLGPDGAADSPQSLDPSGPGLIGGYDIKTNAANRSLVAWSRPVSGSFELRARLIGSDGTIEPGTFSTPDPAGNQQESPATAMGGAGGGAITWLSVPATGNDVVWGREFPAAGSPLAPVMLSSGANDASSPQIAIAPDDVGALAWSETIDPDGPTPQVQIFARQILPPPQCPNATGTIVQGLPTPIALGCTGVHLTTPEILSQPAHGTLGVPDAASQTVVYTPTVGYAGPDSFTFRGTNPAGAGAAQTASLSVGKDTVRPVVKRFQIKPKRKHRRKRATLRAAYSETSTAKITIELRRHCRPHARHCKKFKRFATIKLGNAGLSAKATFKTKIARHKLRNGSYRASIVATDLAGNRSKVKRLTFKVVR